MGRRRKKAAGRQSPTSTAPADQRRARPSPRRLAVLLLLVVVLALVARWPIAAALRSVAWQKIDTHRPAQSLPWLDRSSWLQGQSAETEFLYARAHRKLHSVDLFRQHLDRAAQLGLSPERRQREEWLLAAQRGDLRVAEPHYEDLLADPKNDAREIADAYVRGFIAARRLADAVRLANALQADFPRDAQPRLLRGLIYRELNVLDVAERELRAALQLQPTHPEATFALAQLLADRQRWDEALVYFARSADMPEHSIDAQIGAAQCLRVLGHPDDARALLTPLADAADPPLQAQLEIGRLDFEASNYALAVQRLEKAATSAPRNVAVRAALAAAKSAAGEKQAAAADFEFVTQAKAAATRVRELRARVDAAPDDVQARCEIGRLQLRYGAEQDGLRWLHSALQINPRCSAAHRELADYYLAMADRDPQFAELAKLHSRMIGEAENHPDERRRD